MSALVTEALGRVRLRLHRPQLARVRLGDEVDAGIGSPASRPVLPQPDLAKLVPEDRIVLEVPAADALELATLEVPVVAQV